MHLAAHGAGKFNIAISFSLLQSHLTSMTNPLRIIGYGDLIRRDLGQQTLGTTSVKDKSAETLIALDRRATQNYLLTTHLKADCAPRPVLQDRNPSHLNLCEDFGWRGRGREVENRDYEHPSPESHPHEAEHHATQRQGIR